MKRFILIVFVVFNSCYNPIENKKPNVIIVMTDDQGFGDLGINQNPNIITPNIDKFANKSGTTPIGEKTENRSTKASGIVTVDMLPPFAQV